jgi:hypothetical protein
MARHVDHDFDYPRGFRGPYDPNQPRVPRGHAEGGQWTSGGYRALSELAELPPPDLRGDGEDRTLQTQLALLRERPPIPARTNPPASTPERSPGPIRPDWNAALGGFIIGKILRELFGSGEVATEPVVAFRARLHRWDGEKYVYVADRLLDEEEAKDYCKELDDIRTLLEKAVEEAGPPGKNAGAFGSRVHSIVKRAIKEFNKNPKNRGKELGEPEVSIRKDGTIAVRFEKGTKRPDLHKPKEKVWCVFEHKITMGATLDDGRMDDLAVRLSKYKPPGGTPEYLVIIETKPLNPPELRNLQRRLWRR